MLTKNNFKIGLLTLGMIAAIGVRASDHDDGEIDLKGRSLNLTDLYVFREDWQKSNSVPADQENLILIMNTNARSLPGHSYFFSTNARYEFHFSRVKTADKSVRPTGADDVTLRFTFEAPELPVTNPASPDDDPYYVQPIKLETVKDGVTTPATGVVKTKSLVESVTGPFSATDFSVGGTNIGVSAGMRQDPFFFDVIGFFKTRFALYKEAVVLGGPVTASSQKFPSLSTSFDSKASDFTSFYNVNSIVVRVPLSFLKNSVDDTIFDVWETISVAN